MYSPDVVLKNKERFSKPSTLTKEKVEKALSLAVSRLEKAIDKFGEDKMMTTNGRKDQYQATDAVTWTTGMWTGLYWLAYMYTGNEKFKKAAESHLPYYYKTLDIPEELDDHDTGFKYIPSCVAAYKLTGNEEARKAAIRSAEIQLDHFCQVNQFIIRGGMCRPTDGYAGYRTLVDSMMNIPLFFWAWEETGEQKFYDAAVGHYHTTAKYLIREDGSSYHHYQFDPETKKPVKGVTFQGNRDESCWSRGHSWLLYGYPLAYKFTKDPETIDIHRSVSYFAMDNLPSDVIPYWDYDFNDGSFEPRDASAAAVNACGLYEMIKYLPDDAEQKAYFKNAADMMVEAMIDTCAASDENTDALLSYITIARPMGLGIDVSETYGCFFYFEALLRALDPDFKMFW